MSRSAEYHAPTRVAARKAEHELLESILPGHIIEHLLEEKKTARSVSSSSSGELLELSALRMSSEDRVREVAETHVSPPRPLSLSVLCAQSI